MKAEVLIPEAWSPEKKRIFHCQHLGVAMTCIEKERADDFDDIGIDDLSEALKRSALRAVESEAIVLISSNATLYRARQIQIVRKFSILVEHCSLTTEKSLRSRSSKSRRS